MKSRNLLLSIVILFIILVLLSVLYPYKKSEKTEIIDSDKYEETSGGLLSKKFCGNNDFCEQEFNENWKCQKIDNNERCVCIITDENNRVCGIDGRTYRNPSEANCLGIDIDYEGDCNGDCLCTALYDPVCGADGKTYSNICYANCAKVTFVHKGECALNFLCVKCINECVLVDSFSDRPKCPGPTENFNCELIGEKCKKIQFAEQEFKTCKNNQEFKCLPVTQGMYDPNPPIVCGCMPIQCPSGQSLIVYFIVSGTWPDGTRKGTGGCSSNLPP